LQFLPAKPSILGPADPVLQYGVRRLFVALLMREASGAPSPKHSRNASRRGMLLTPLREPLATGSARESGGVADMRSLRRTARPMDSVAASDGRAGAKPGARMLALERPRRPDVETVSPDRPSAASRENSRRIAGVARHASTNGNRTVAGRRHPSLASPSRAGGSTTRPVRLVCGARRRRRAIACLAIPDRMPMRGHPVRRRTRRTTDVAVDIRRLAAVASCLLATGGNGGCRRLLEPDIASSADAFAYCQKLERNPKSRQCGFQSRSVFPVQKAAHGAQNARPFSTDLSTVAAIACAAGAVPGGKPGRRCRPSPQSVCTAA